jgi:hypothetical protein
MRGGCLCGAVRFRLAAAPFDAGWCHCRTCQLNSGAPAMAFASIAPPDYVVEAGNDALRAVPSSATGERVFCSRCGTPLLMREADGSGAWDFSIATLDDPASVPPGFHIFYASRIPWAEAADDLPRHARTRPETTSA